MTSSKIEISIITKKIETWTVIVERDVPMVEELLVVVITITVAMEEEMVIMEVEEVVHTQEVVATTDQTVEVTMLLDQEVSVDQVLVDPDQVMTTVQDLEVMEDQEDTIMVDMVDLVDMDLMVVVIQIKVDRTVVDTHRQVVVLLQLKVIIMEEEDHMAVGTHPRAEAMEVDIHQIEDTITVLLDLMMDHQEEDLIHHPEEMVMVVDMDPILEEIDPVTIEVPILQVTIEDLTHHLLEIIEALTLVEVVVDLDKHQLIARLYLLCARMVMGIIHHHLEEEVVEDIIHLLVAVVVAVVIITHLLVEEVVVDQDTHRQVIVVDLVIHLPVEEVDLGILHRVVEVDLDILHRVVVIMADMVDTTADLKVMIYIVVEMAISEVIRVQLSKILLGVIKKYILLRTMAVVLLYFYT